MQPFNWNVVVTGKWNTAILSPIGIATRLFGLPEGAPIEVQVPMDGVAPIRVQHDGILVSADRNRVIVEAMSPTYEGLAACMAVARRAVGGLPETPFTAAGYNVKFTLSDDSDALVSAMSAPMDTLLADAEKRILERHTRRTVEYMGGVINIEASMNRESIVALGLNFHLASTDPSRLQGWLDAKSSDIKASVDLIVRTLGVTSEALA